MRADERRDGGHLAVRCPRRLLRCSGQRPGLQHGEPEVSARFPSVRDAIGQVKFTTVYPGWYPGRATHIHFKIRKGNEEFTSQFFFDDTLSSEINNTLAPYSQKGANGRTQNATDSIYRQSNGMLLLDVQRSGSGYAAMFDIGIQA